MSNMLYEVIDVDKITEIFDNGRKINVIKDVAENTIGVEETNNVWREARIILKDILNRYPTIQPKEQLHTDLIFPHIAVYKALLRSHSDKAVKIMEDGEAITAKESAKSFQKIVSLPFGKTIFLKAFAAGCKSGFGPEAGFANIVHNAGSKEYKMDVTACPYVKYCNSEGCPELTHIFCDNDVYAYGHLKGIRFIRTETLGTGGSRCDFLLVRDK